MTSLTHRVKNLSIQMEMEHGMLEKLLLIVIMILQYVQGMMIGQMIWAMVNGMKTLLHIVVPQI